MENNAQVLSLIKTTKEQKLPEVQIKKGLKDFSLPYFHLDVFIYLSGQYQGNTPLSIRDKLKKLFEDLHDSSTNLSTRITGKLSLLKIQIPQELSEFRNALQLIKDDLKSKQLPKNTQPGLTYQGSPTVGSLLISLKNIGHLPKFLCLTYTVHHDLKGVESKELTINNLSQQNLAHFFDDKDMERKYEMLLYYVAVNDILRVISKFLDAMAAQNVAKEIMEEFTKNIKTTLQQLWSQIAVFFHYDAFLAEIVPYINNIANADIKEQLIYIIKDVDSENISAPEKFSKLSNKLYETFNIFYKTAREEQNAADNKNEQQMQQIILELFFPLFPILKLLNSPQNPYAKNCLIDGILLSEQDEFIKTAVSNYELETKSTRQRTTTDFLEKLLTKPTSAIEITYDDTEMKKLLFGTKAPQSEKKATIIQKKGTVENILKVLDDHFLTSREDLQKKNTETAIVKQKPDKVNDSKGEEKQSESKCFTQ